MAQKDIELGQLHERVQELESQMAQTLQAHALLVASLEQKIQTQQGELELLGKKLQANPTPAEVRDIKKQLDLLKSVEYELGEDEIVSEKTVVRILKEKSRRLETENIKLKAQVGELEGELAEVKVHHKTLQDKVSGQTQLIAKLEEDISKHCSTLPSPSLSFHDESLVKMNGGAAGGEEAFSMIEVVCSQRDRFKARTQQLEIENRKLHSQLGQVQEEIDALRQDNVKLYEKIRYLQSYNTTRQQDKAGTDLERVSGDEPYEAKYRKMYEDSVNPFLLFNRREKHERYKELNAAEKVTLRTGRFFLANKYSRTFIFFYALALHILVFLTLYKLAHTTATPNTP